jgi:hypothetical protein
MTSNSRSACFRRSPLAARRSPLAARRSPLAARRSPLRLRQWLDESPPRPVVAGSRIVNVDLDARRAAGCDAVLIRS